MNQEILSKLNSFFERNPTLKGKSATNEEIENAEKLTKEFDIDKYKPSCY